MSLVRTRDNVNLFVKDWGKGRPVIMLHGWPLSSDTFDDLGMAIAGNGMRAIAYDRRGFGRSDQPWHGYGYDSLADDLADVIAATGAIDATLVGFSMGGGEVARYMSRHEGRHVSQAVLMSSVVPYMAKTTTNPHGTDVSVFAGMAAGIRADRAKFWTTFFANFYGVAADASPVSQEVVDWSRDVSMQASLRSTLACAESFASEDFRPDLKAFHVPTLVIHGTADTIVPIDAAGRAAAKGIAQSTLLEYEGAPHGVLASHKDRVIVDVMTFVRQQTTVGAR